MRRLILEVLEKDLCKIGVLTEDFQKIESLELRHVLRQDTEQFAVIARIEFKDETSRIDDFLADGVIRDAQVLEQQNDRSYIVFMKGGPSLSPVLDSMGIEGGYLFPPVEIHDGKIKFSILGTSEQIQKSLERVASIGLRYKIVSLTDAKFSPTSPLAKLTEKQRQVIITAYKLGYYDIPRRINSENLARKLNIGNSALGEHLRKAERCLLDENIRQMLNE
ncbi:MAG TPA: helix-turn-helix domain-containing protein [Candidatus Bathyarchaeia archaeon]|nr:helix-turn-helix domain-containing protein [Candidatus Bathyarchaeia archaeon]